MKKYHHEFQTFLEQNGGRYTSQKEAIVDELLKTSTHFEVEDFIDTIRKRDKKVSRATVYRTIRQLLDAGMIQKISTLDGKVFYEKSQNKKQHDHLICNSCGDIFEIKEDVIKQYLEDFCGSIGFRPMYRSVHIYGLCKRCAKASATSED